MTARYDELYYDLCASIVLYAKNKIATLLVEFPDLVFIDWDEHAEIHELPDRKDLMGPAGVGLVNDGEFFDVTFSVGVSTVNDPGNFRIRALVSKIFGDLQPQQQLQIYRAATTTANVAPTPVGWLQMQPPTIATPMSRAETRKWQFVQARGLLDPRVPFEG